jgi:restriction endonuclease S subunit/energy-coupling factor transporter ATP-binding protein EcfA2
MSNLPDSWLYSVLSEIALIQMGQSPDSRSYNKQGDGLPFFQGKAEFGKLFPTVRKWCNNPKKVAEVGDILLSVRAPVGPTNLAIDKCCIGRGLASIQAITPFNQKYLLHYFRKIESWLTEQGTGTTFAAISGDFIRSLDIPIAPINEQKRIADKLDDFFARVDACRDQLDHVSLILKRFQKSVLSAATSGQLAYENSLLTESDETTFLCLSQVIERLKTGPFGSALHRSDYVLNGIPVVNPMHINAGRITPTSEMTISEEKAEKLQEYLLQEGDIILARRGVMGRCAVVGIKEKGWLCGSGSMIIRTTDRILPEYLQIFLSSPSVVKVLEENAVGSTMVNLNQRILLDLTIPVPSIAMQELIIRQVNVLFSYRDRLESLHRTACDQIERLIPALLDKAFRGELVPQDLNDEPASILLEKIKTEKIRMESEQKTEHTARRSTRQTPKATMKQASDYLEALRSAFEASENTTNARQLFDQAGFSPEDVVTFYEALRVAPEIRAAFPREQRSQQPQNNTVKITNQLPSENRRFRLIELWLEDFKNLANYTVRFDPAHSIDVVLGWNGTGKSNLFEALVIIFRDLSKWHEKNQWPKIPMKGYQLRYIIDGKTVEISWHPGEMKRPKLTMQLPQSNTEEANKPKLITRSELPLPRFIFGYYSGPTNRLAEHFLPMKQDHYERLLKATSDDPDTLNHLLEQRQFFCAENHHAKYVLLAFCHKEDADISRFLEDRLRIVGFESALFIIRKPRWAKKGQTAEDFWGAQGIMRRVMERLRRFAIAPMVVEQTVPDGFRSQREDHYYFFLPDLQSLHDFAAEYQDARTFFLALESTDFSELIYDVKIQVRVKSTNTEEVPITFHELSEGEQQLLMVLGLMRFTKSHQSLVLLDEPDTHLNPHWSIEYLKLLTRLMSEDTNQSEEQQTSQILMSTHDPLVIASLFKEQIHLLRRDCETGVCKWTQPSVNPRGLGFTGILTSEMFGMRSDLDEETLADLDNKVRLVAKEGTLTPNELEELEEINKRLEDAGFQKAFSDPYYAAFIRAWSQRHNELMAGVRFLNPDQQQEVDRIAREVLEEVMLELQAEAVG